MNEMAKDASKSDTQSFYDQIADVHNLVMQLNGYRASVTKYLQSLDLKLGADSYVLDAGSGTGIVTLGFLDAGFRPKKTVALDLSLNLLKISGEQFEKEKNIDAERVAPVQGNILKMPFADETFDLVLTCGVLEYVPLEDGLREMARVLKTGARLVLIPVKPSLIGSMLEILYKFKTHPVEEVRRISAEYYNILDDYEFPIIEPIGWSKMIFLLEKK
ncbi:MAG TPA: class I SAM-dependent methyltransferase [Pyrinomonadaceae bacterium]